MTATVHSIVKLYPPNAVSRVAVAMRGGAGMLGTSGNFGWNMITKVFRKLLN